MAAVGPGWHGSPAAGRGTPNSPPSVGGRAVTVPFPEPSTPTVRPGRDDIGTGPPHDSERAERASRRAGPDDSRSRPQQHRGPIRAGEPDDGHVPDHGKKSPGFGRLVVVVLATLVVVTTSFGWAAKGWLGSSIRNAAALEPGSDSIVDAADQHGDQNILIATVDAGSARVTRTGDTMVVAHIPAGGGPLVVLSIPTDLEINRPPCDRFDPVAVTYPGTTVPAEARTRLSTAATVGGPRCTTRVVQQLTGLAITGYVGMDLDRLGAVVDAVSAVAVCEPPVPDGAPGPVPSTAGVLDGRRALDYVRATTATGDASSDHTPIERQQRVVAAVLGEALSTTGLLDIGQLAALRPALEAAFVSDATGLDQLLALALSLRQLDAPDVRFAALPVEPERNGRGNSVLRSTDATALFRALRADTPLPQAPDPRTGPGPSPADRTPAPAEVTVQVLNAAERPGLAAEVSTTLQSLGFGVGDFGNAEQPAQQTMIRFAPDQAAAAELLISAIPSATTVAEPGPSGLLQLVLGRSFDGTVRAPTGPPATPRLGLDAIGGNCS